MNPLHRRRPAGFTLIELMVTLTIGAILLMIAAPSFVSFQRNSELTSAANSLVAAINAARGEAMKRGMSAVLVPASGTSDWSQGWTVFVDMNRNQAFDSATDVLVLQQRALSSYFTASGEGTAKDTPAYIMFDASGYTKTSTATFRSLTMTITRNDLTGTAQTEQTRRIVIAKTGRARTCRPAADTSCTTTADE
ncbi:MAG: GspH/FimT family pseudopilin [Variovorax sp.]